MTDDFVNSIKEQKKIPIIGKGSYDEIINKAANFISRNYKIIEITLRSKNAIDAALHIKKNHSNIIIGIGSIISIDQLINIQKYNFNFYVSPGINSKMLDFCKKNQLNFIPGVSTTSEIIKGIEFNCNLFKFFHSEQSGGTKMLKSIKDIFPNIGFIPTGGINNKNYISYINLSNVVAVGSTNF